MTKAVEMYLKQVFNLDKEVSSLINEYEKSKIVNLSASKFQQVVVDSSNVSSSTEETVLKRYEYGHQILEKTNQLINLKIKISGEIDQIEERNYRVLLRHRYINCKGWVPIAKLMNYDASWIYKMHKDALVTFKEAHAEIFKEKELEENKTVE